MGRDGRHRPYRYGIMFVRVADNRPMILLTGPARNGMNIYAAKDFLQMRERRGLRGGSLARYLPRESDELGRLTQFLLVQYRTNAGWWRTVSHVPERLIVLSDMFHEGTIVQAELP